MPSIDVAMARSLRGSPVERIRDVLARSVAAGLTQRGAIADASEKITDIKTALSSWDNCMAVVWCKWPVIGIIILVSVIILSIVWCIIRCCCCGLSCCCSCFQCLKCCGNCCGCCDPPGGRKHKHLDDPYAPAPETNSHAYRSEPPMNPAFSSGAINNQFTPTTQHWQNEPPKYAEFEVRGAKNDEDSLPEMPTMEKAEVTTKVGLHDDVELDQLKKSPVQEQYGMMNGTPSAMPQGRSPYGQQQGNNSAYLNGYGQAPESYSPIDHKGYGYQNQADGYGHDQYGVGAPMDRHSPANDYNYNHNQNAGYDQNDGYHQNTDHGYGQSHGGYGEYNNTNQGYGMTQPPATNRTPIPELSGYGVAQPPAPSRSPIPELNGYSVTQPPAPSRTPIPELNGYGYGVAPSRSPAPQNTLDDYLHSARKTPAIQDSYGYQSEQAYSSQRTFPPAPVEAHYGPRPVPQRQYPQQDPPRSPLNNNSGFDFNSGFARPDQSPTTEAYPGHKPYQH